jgi:hypothetical protein
MKFDERLDYYLMVARLMAEADAQMREDALDGGSQPYAEDLWALRRAVQAAEDAAARIVVGLAEKAMPDDESGGVSARH